MDEALFDDLLQSLSEAAAVAKVRTKSPRRIDVNSLEALSPGSKSVLARSCQESKPHQFDIAQAGAAAREPDADDKGQECCSP
ncbi:hypothetical protein [Caldimonas sp. KR1-144]|uniref:hypothetical protein n=1 Tax=Caldimonas sp. KR1-144 TaxID=3400911 RepID=UPI003C0F573A